MLQSHSAFAQRFVAACSWLRWQTAGREPPPDEAAAFHRHTTPQVRMNGGTNIAAALAQAGALLKARAGPGCGRLVVLLTDGRVDGYQSREAKVRFAVCFVAAYAVALCVFVTLCGAVLLTYGRIKVRKVRTLQSVSPRVVGKRGRPCAAD